MSSESIFVKAEAPTVEGSMPHETHKFAQVLDAENPSAYHFNHAQGSQVGTLVPVPTFSGGIKGSGNPFGQVVAGVEVRKENGRLVEVPFVPTWLGEMIKSKKARKEADMSAKLLAQKLQGNAPKVEEEVDDQLEAIGDDETAEQAEADAKVLEDMAERRAAIRADVARQRKAEEELRQLMPKEAAPAQGLNEEAVGQLLQFLSAMDRTKTPPAVERTEAPVRKAPAVERVADEQRVTLRGAFGTYRGTYRYVYPSDDLVVLVYGIDTPVFTPPPGEEPFQLVCGETSYTVYFAGIDFELPFAKCGVQVMIRGK
jgi:hypothetical protein